MSRERGLEIASAFFAASRRGDLDGLGKVLADDVRFHTDGGGKRPSATRILEGFGEVARFLTRVAKYFDKNPSRLVRYDLINGLPGFITREADGLQTTALLIEEDRIRAIYVMRNPDKLGYVERSVN